MIPRLSDEISSLKGKKVLIRVDFNVPLDERGQCTDATRIRASLESIKAILAQNAKLIIMSHLGRPKGRVDQKYSLKPCVPVLEDFLGQKVLFANECVGEEVEHIVDKMREGDVLLLENLRFHPGEEKPELEPDFHKKLKRLADVYVNDAFGTAHRKHASTYLLPKEFPSHKMAGSLLSKEVSYLSELFNEPRHPFVAIVGGAKLSSKLGVLAALLKKADTLVIGGGMAFTFLKAMGLEVGKSLVEESFVPEARNLLIRAKNEGKMLILPQDVLTADAISPQAKTELISINQGIASDMMGVDIGPKTCELIKNALNSAEVIFWNGPMGVAEIEAFAHGTEFVGKLLADSKAITVVGGGDSVAAINKLGLGGKMDHISTGGGASLELIEMGTLPALECLSSV